MRQHLVFVQQTLYPVALSNSLYSPLQAELKSCVNTRHADREGHTAAAARGTAAPSSLQKKKSGEPAVFA